MDKPPPETDFSKNTKYLLSGVTGLFTSPKETLKTGFGNVSSFVQNVPKNTQYIGQKIVDNPVTNTTTDVVKSVPGSISTGIETLGYLGSYLTYPNGSPEQLGPDAPAPAPAVPVVKGPAAEARAQAAALHYRQTPEVVKGPAVAPAAATAPIIVPSQLPKLPPGMKFKGTQKRPIPTDFHAPQDALIYKQIEVNVYEKPDEKKEEFLTWTEKPETYIENNVDYYVYKDAITGSDFLSKGRLPTEISGGKRKTYKKNKKTKNSKKTKTKNSKKIKTRKTRNNKK